MASAFAACGPQNDISSGAGVVDYPVTIGTVSLKAQTTGVAVLSKNLADVILAIGYEAQLKAKSAECTQSDLSVLTDVTANDASKIKSLGADLVLADTPLTTAQSEAMTQAGITVLQITKATGREDLDRLYSQVGAAFKGAKTGYERGKKISQSIFLTIDDISRIIPESKTPTSVAYLYDDAGSVVTGDTLEGKLIDSAGLVNAATDGVNNKMAISELLLSDPKYIFCPTGVKAKLAASAEYKKLTAVKSGKVYEMDPDLMILQGRGLVDAVSFMAGTVYPELLKNTTTDSSASSGTASGTSSAVAPTVALQKDAKGADVTKMQKRLLELGYLFVNPTGLYGDGTVQSVKDFQLLNGLTVTGIADTTTLQKMFASDAKKRPAE